MPLSSARQVTEGDGYKCYEDYQCYQESKLKSYMHLNFG